MAVGKILLTGLPGDYKVAYPALGNATIYGVWRSGTAFNGVASNPLGLEYSHVATKIVFDPANRFTGTLADDIRETVLVLYEI